MNRHCLSRSSKSSRRVENRERKLIRLLTRTAFNLSSRVVGRGAILGELVFGVAIGSLQTLKQTAQNFEASMSITSAQLGDLREKAGQKRVQKSDLPTPEPGKRRSKYGAVRSVDADGLKWDSKRERARWGELKFMEKAGLICDLERQPVFPIFIIPAFPSPDGPDSIVVGQYKGDFQYVRLADDELIVEDVKGFKTPLYKFKKKIVEAYYGITITEIM